MKRTALFLLLCLLASVFAACNHIVLSMTDRRYESGYPHKVINVSYFNRAVISEGVLRPGEGSVWGMDRIGFIERVYGSEVVDPKSVKFVKTRNLPGVNYNVFSRISPPIRVVFANVDRTASAYPIYRFNNEGELYSIAYKYILDLSQKEQLEKMVKRFVMLLSAEKYLRLVSSQGQLPDLDTIDYEYDRLDLEWHAPKQNQYIRLRSSTSQDDLIFYISIINKSYAFD